MSTPPRMDPAVATMLAAARFAGPPPSWSLSVDEARAAVHDICDAFDHVVEHAQRLGIDAERLAIDGDTLAAVLAVHARDRGAQRDVLAALRAAFTTAASFEETS